jgi:hypothetical protein
MRCNLSLAIVVGAALAGAAMLAVLGTFHARSAQADTVSEAQEKLDSLSPEARHELLQKKERFEQLKEVERERMRELHASIHRSPDCKRLMGTLERYHQWLMTLTPLQRDELVSLPLEKRIDRIKQIQKEQQKQRFRDLTSKLPPEDFDAIIHWLETFIESHQEEIADQMMEPFKTRYRSLPDAEQKQKRRMLAFTAIAPRRSDAKPILPGEQFETLVPQLSSLAQKELLSVKDAAQKEQILRDWLRAAVMIKLAPQVTDEQLRDFFQGLSVVERERLEALPPEQMRLALRGLYFQRRFHQEWRLGGPPPRPGERRSGFGDGRGSRDGAEGRWQGKDGRGKSRQSPGIPAEEAAESSRGPKSAND